MLAAASKVWNAKFERWSSSEAQKGELDHCETDSIVMEKLMDIIYTGKTQVDNRAELVALAKEAECFNMQSVKTVVEDELKEFVSKETCCELLMIARNSGLDGLDAACKEVLLREFEEVRWRVGVMTCYSSIGPSSLSHAFRSCRCVSVRTSCSWARRM